DQCHTCGSYFDEEFSSGTETEADVDMEDWNHYQTVDVDGDLKNDENAIGSQIYFDYQAAKQRWRRFTGKPPRRYRRYNLKRGQHSPEAKEAERAKEVDPGRTREARLAAVERMDQACMAAVLQHEQTNFPVALPGVNYDFMTTRASASVASNSGSVAGGAGWCIPEIEQLRSVSQTSSVVSSNSSRRRKIVETDASGSPTAASTPPKRQMDSPPGWYPSIPSVTGGQSVEEADQAGAAPVVTAVTSGLPAPAFPPPSGVPCLSSTALVSTSPTSRGQGQSNDQEDRVRQRTVDGLNSILLGISNQQAGAGGGFGSQRNFPWWEIDCTPTEAIIAGETTYHMKTRMQGNRVGLLVDPGAHDNLIGEETLHRLEEQVGAARRRPLTRRLSVEGVGEGAQQALEAARVPIFLLDEYDTRHTGSFTSPVIPGSSLPPLLGMKSLMKRSAIMDMGSGTLVLPLSLSQSGHLILPVDLWKENPRPGQKQGRNDLDFVMEPTMSMLAEGLSFWSGLFAINLDSDKKLCNDSVPEPCIFNMICIHEGMVIRRFCALEANVRSQAWNMRALSAIMQLMQISKHRYCNYQLASPGGMRPCNAVIQMCANFPVPDAEPCRCGRKEDHCHLKQLNKVEQEAVERMMIFGIIDACVKCLMAKEKILLPPSGQLQDGRNDQPESEDEFKKVKIQALHQRRKSEASTVRFDLNVTSYPTDGAERHKQRKKEGYVPNKQVIKSEVHNDDCGEDLSGIMNIDLPCEAVHFMGLVGQSEVSKDGNLTFKMEHELSRLLLSDGRWLRGSDACLNPGADCDLPQLAQHLYERDNLKDDNDDLTYHQHNTTPGQSCLKHNHVSTAPLPRPGIDVVEIFGGEGRTTQVLVKRFGAIPGKNFDLVVNWDLLDPEHEVQHGLDFLIEQPWQSELFGMKEWENVFAQIRVFGIVVDQCMLGLKMDKPPYAPVKKPTEFLSSSEVVLRPLLGRQCDGRHEHANIGVWSATPRLSMPSTKAQIWPWKLCSVLAAGIFDLLCSKGRDLMYVLQHFVSCPGCRGHLRRDDPKHTRSGDCRFPRDDAADWTCKGCVLNKPRADPLHTLVTILVILAWLHLLNQPEVIRAVIQIPILMEMVMVETKKAETTLRRLHIRWYHPGAARMKALLQAAGVTREVINLVQDVTDTCRICRAWSRPGPRSMTTTTLRTRFNEEVQIDLLFYRQYIILHMLDVCTRWTVASLMRARDSDEITKHMQTKWFGLFGPPTLIVCDQEGGLTTEGVGAWLERRGVALKLRAPGQHAQMVERHHEVLRQQLHKLEAQATDDGLRVGFEEVLSEAVFVKNILTTVGNHTPFEAVLGRTPPLLNVLGDQVEMGDDRDAYRLRHAAIESMIQSTAQDRAARAGRHKTRPAGELLEIQAGDQIEFWRKPSTKDVEAWRGPATVCDTTSLKDGIVGIRWQGRNLICRTQDVRRALVFLQMLATKAASDPLNVLLMTVEDHISFTVRLGWLYNNGQWRQCEANRHFSEPLMAGLFVAENVFFLKGVYGMRFGTGVQSLAAISCDDTFVVWWETGRSGDWRHCFMPGTSHLNVERLTENNASRISIIQFLITDDPRFATPRKVLDIDEATASSNSTSRTKGFGRGTPSKIKMILDGDANGHQEGGTVSHEQAASGSGSSSAKIVSAPGTPRSHAADSDVTVESQPVREGHGFIDDNDVKQEYEDEDWELEGIRRRSRDLQMSFVSRAPDAGQHVSGGNSYVLEEDKIDADQPELVLPNHYLSYITSTEKFKKPRQMRQDEELVFRCGKGRQWFAVIERVNNVLTREEALQEVDSCRESMIQELARWHKHGAWRRIPRSRCNNLLTSKWVLKWKDVAGKRAIKARMVAQGFKDAQQTCNYSATTSRWAQRLVIIMAVQFKWRLVSADVSEAFLRGLTFKELFEGGTGREMRNVQLALPAGCDELIRTIPGMEDFDSQVEGLELLKPGFGLKDAPRMWSLALSRVLAAAGVLPTRVDPQLYVKHNALGELLILLSVHVDDLKITGRHDEVDALLALLNKEFDQLKLEVDNFTHLGIKHKLLDDGSREVSQDHYG
ncbi:unnamed protein product, partial [Effrenium voratum]